MNHHARIPDVLVISAKTMSALSPQEQEWVQQAATESSAFQRKAWEAGVEEALAQMVKAGVTIHKVEIEPFVRATESVRTRYSTGPMLDCVNRIEGVKAP